MRELKTFALAVVVLVMFAMCAQANGYGTRQFNNPIYNAPACASGVCGVQQFQQPLYQQGGCGVQQQFLPPAQYVPPVRFQAPVYVPRQRALAFDPGYVPVQRARFRAAPVYGVQVRQAPPAAVIVNRGLFGLRRETIIVR